MIEPKDIFPVVVAGTATVSGLLLILIGFLLSARASLVQRSLIKEAQKYHWPIGVIVGILTLNIIVTLIGLAWPLSLLYFLSDQQISYLLLIAFGVLSFLIIPLAIWLACRLT